MKVEALFDKDTSTFTYIVYQQEGGDALVIDPVLNYDSGPSTCRLDSINSVGQFLKDKKLVLCAILETHAHADHITGAAQLKRRYPDALVGIGEGICKVQKTFKNVFNLSEMRTDGAQFDRLLKDGETWEIGQFSVKVFSTPGHTPACSSYLIEDCLFTGDAIFIPDFGTGRCDFPDGSASDLYDSISEKLYKLPDETKVYVGHDYRPGGRELRWESSIGEEKAHNIHLNAETTREEFISFRTKRDAELSAPRLLLPSIQINIDGGHFPTSESNGQSYIKIPVSLQES